VRSDISGLIPIAGGLYVLLAAFRVVRVSKNPETNEVWLRKFGDMSKVLGPILIVGGILELFGVFR
jgi:hypothetical protein